MTEFLLFIPYIGYAFCAVYIFFKDRAQNATQVGCMEETQQLHWQQPHHPRNGQHTPYLPVTHFIFLALSNLVLGKNIWITLRRGSNSNCDMGLPALWSGNCALYLYLWPNSFIGISTWGRLFLQSCYRNGYRNYGCSLMNPFPTSLSWMPSTPGSSPYPYYTNVFYFLPGLSPSSCYNWY